MMTHPLVSNAPILTVEIRDDSSWISPIARYLKNETLPEDRNAIVKIKARTTRYALINDILYRRSFSEPYKRCVPPDKAKRIIEQVHGGVCSTYIGGQSLCHRVTTGLR